MRLGARVASDAGGLAGNPGTTGARCMWTELRGRGAGGEAAEMTGCDPSALDARFERLRNVGESDLQGSGQLGSGLVAELADRAVLVGYVLLVADGGSDRGAGQRQRQGDNPSPPAWATSCEPRVHGIALGHQTADATRESPKAARVGADATPNRQRCLARTDALDSGSLSAGLFDGAVETDGGNGRSTTHGARATELIFM